MNEQRTAAPVAATELASVHLDAIRRRWWLPLAGALIAGLLAYLVSASGQPRYDASAAVLLTQAEPISVLTGNGGGANGDPERTLNTEVALVKLQSVAVHVRGQLQLPLTPTQLLNEVQVTPQGTTNLVAITARDADPGRAAQIANAFAARYLVVRRDLAQAAYRDAADLAQQKLDSLTPEQLQGSQGTALRTRLRQLVTTGALQTGDAQMVDPATVPSTPSSPRPKFAGAVGGLIGLVLGALSAIAWAAADRRRSARPAGSGRSWNLRRPDWLPRRATVGATEPADEPLPASLAWWEQAEDVHAAQAEGNGHGLAAMQEELPIAVEAPVLADPLATPLPDREKSKSKK